MRKLIVFAGTREGREIAELLNRYEVKARICVATEYGESLLPEGEFLEISHHRLDEEEMCGLFSGDALVIDATHPYAQVVTENIRQACESTGASYIRVIRPEEYYDREKVIFVDSVAEAAAFLCGTTGNILTTTGSKELKEYTVIPDYAERVYARVLSLPEVAASCCALGFTGKHLICMQGPFSLELNVAMMKQYDIRYMVTKESGKKGGFPEKVQAAALAGAQLVVVGRPKEEEGLTLEETKQLLIRSLNLPASHQVSLVGIGPGSRDQLTLEALRTLQEADCIIGAKRMVEAVKGQDQPFYYSYKPEDIRDFILAHPEYEKVAVALSGDVGFYSGAKKLQDTLQDMEVRRVPGISSLIMFCARAGVAWEDVKVASAHGRAQNLLGYIRKYPKVFAIMGTKTACRELARQLKESGLGDIRMLIGERLTYPEERLLEGTPADFVDVETDFLCVVYLENPSAAKSMATHGLPDETFLRDKVPMTKEEVRTCSVSKLHLTENAVVYDIGAGTGSVSLEIAAALPDSMVYAIERKPEAAQLIRKNQAHLGITNLQVVEALAPEGLAELPVPTHAFLGGTAGNMKDILQVLFDKNPHIRIVINAITLETVTEALNCLKEFPVTEDEIVCMNVSRSKAVGPYHMMMGQNPVYILSFTGNGSMEGEVHE